MGESTEELKANMEKAFAGRVEADRELSVLAERLNSGKGTYAAAEDYAYRAGNVLSGVFRDNIKVETLENGIFTKEFIEGAVIPLLKDDHRIVSAMAAVAQENINTAAGVHIRAQKADFNQDRADGFVTKMDGKTMDEAGWMLGSPVSNFSQSVVDETMRKNGEVLAKAGKAATIRREAEAKCCDWCLSKAGSYDATNREAYQRHRECRCVIEMHLDGNVKRQADWKHNQWQNQRKQAENRHTKLMGDRVHRLENMRTSGIIKTEEMRVYTEGKRNEIPLTDAQKAETERVAREQGFRGQIIYSDHAFTAFHGSVEGERFCYLVIGTDVYPSSTNGGTPNERITMRGCLAHEIIGHYRAWERGTTKAERPLEEAQASIRASRYGKGLSKEERETLFQDAMERLKAVDMKFEDVKEILDIKEV